MLITHLSHRLREREAASLRRFRRIAETACAPRQTVSDESGNAMPQAVLTFCSNDYLGLASHPALVAALSEGARCWGGGSGGSHLVSGHTRVHVRLEEALAAHLAPCIPDGRALSFSTGYMANMALLTTLGDVHASIFSDQLNHASLIDGILLSRAARHRYPHRQLDVLESQLQACTTPVKLIVTDTVFSMDGDFAPLPMLLDLAERYDAWLIVDDAHGFGVLGVDGRGALSHFGLSSERFIYMGTLGKAAGVSGAFVVAHPVVVDTLVQLGRSYIYTTAAPPLLAHALCTSLSLIAGDEGAQRRAHLLALTAALRGRLEQIITSHPDLGWQLGESTTAIQPLIVGDNQVALALASALKTQGFWVPAIRPPTVPAGTARLRITLSAAHTLAEVEALCTALEGLAAEGIPGL